MEVRFLPRGCALSSVGRAIALHAKGRGFEPLRAHKMEMSEPTLIYEDQDILALNKLAGWRVQADQFHLTAPNILDWARVKYPEALLAHRLDKETSGVLLLAKNETSYEYLKKLFQTGGMKKKYLALVYGRVKTESGLIDWPIGRSRKDPRQRLAIDPARIQSRLRGKVRPARTEYQVLERFPNFTYLEARPWTGRTHQLRVHFKALGHPIVCDALYAPGCPCLPGLTRQALHAASLEFILPSGQPIKLEAEPPADFSQTLAL